MNISSARALLFVAFALSVAAASCDRTPAPTRVVSSAQEATPQVVPEGAVVRNIPFVATLDGVPVQCVTDPASAETAIIDARFFVHGVEVRSPDGEWREAALAEVEHWQTREVALLSLVARADRCAEHPEAPNAMLSLLLAPDQVVDGVRGRIGVPFGLNHADPTTLSGPLTQMQMYWSWRAGFRFVRLDGVHNGETFEVHYGSTQCTGETEAIEACERSNVGRFEIPGDAAASGVDVNLDLFLNAPLLAGGHCTAGAETPACVAAHHALGIDPTSGSTAAPAPSFTAGSI
jgi:uncharacterized repeat protein (TIGR04052 family)